MALQKRRYYSWLLRAYFKRWKKTILGALALSIIVSIGVLGLVIFYINPLLQDQEQRIGYSGVFHVEDIPDEILNSVSMGLTRVNDKGEVLPGAAERWEIKDNKEYTFYLRRDLKFHDGRKFNSKTIPFNFEDVKREVVDEYTIRYTLKDPYAPFLTSVSRPILLKDLSGLGEYKINDVELNAGFVKSITLKNAKNPAEKKVITFYPTQEALKIAFSLGEIDKAEGLINTVVKDYDLKKWPSTKLKENIDEDTMVTVFFNTQDNILSEKRLRQALHYALPEKVEFGKRAFSPIPESSIYFAPPPNYGIADKELAKQILSSAQKVEKPIKISADDDLKAAAEVIQKNWKEIGIPSEIEIVNTLPSSFQVLLYQMNVPDDPDQYILWHSDQRNNISNYKNLRIDKLLEDGRSITDISERKEIYSDFQKYLMDDVPASFFYTPKVYELSRLE